MAVLDKRAVCCRFFDIAVPRNVAADVDDAPGCRVYNVDDLKEVSYKHPAPISCLACLAAVKLQRITRLASEADCLSELHKKQLPTALSALCKADLHLQEGQPTCKIASHDTHQ